jgi:hypothetical protein
MDPSLMSPEELEDRANIIVGKVEPRTKAGRLMHRHWHQELMNECGSAGCSFLGRILAIEKQAYEHGYEAGQSDQGQ